MHRRVSTARRYRDELTQIQLTHAHLISPALDSLDTGALELQEGKLYRHNSLLEYRILTCSNTRLSDTKKPPYIPHDPELHGPVGSEYEAWGKQSSANLEANLSL